MDSKTQTKDNWILRGDGFDLSFAEYFYSESGKKISNWLSIKDKRLESKFLSYRVINHWENKGLLDSDRPQGSGWRKYSLMDIIWVHIITRLRAFGYPIEMISKVKNNLDKHRVKSNHPHSPLLEYYIAHAFVFRKPVYLLVFENGEVEPVFPDELNLGLKLETIHDFIKIDINNILQKLFPNHNLKPENEMSLEVNKAELDLMFMIRNNEYETIKIKLDSGEIERIEGSASVDVENRIIEILNENKYQDIEIKQQNGNITYINKTVKKKYK